MDLQGLLCGFHGDKFSASGGLFNFSGAVKPKCRRRCLPLGSGTYTVGCVDLMSDTTVTGTFVRLYYPTKKTDIYKREAQWPLWLPRKQYGKGYAYFRRKNTKVFGTILNKLGGDVYVPVLWQAPLLKKNDHKYPVIVFSHGLGGNRTTYTTICTDLASHGFIVAAIEHRDGSASMTFCLSNPRKSDDIDLGSNKCDVLQRNYSFRQYWLKYERQEVEDDFHVRNKQIHVRAEEMKQVLNFLEDMNNGRDVHNVLGQHFDMMQFKDRMDMERAAVLGHSFGGSTAIATLAKDKRFKVGVALDSWMLPLDNSLYSNVTQPVLMVNTETFQWKENVKDMFRLHVNSEARRDRILITLRGTCHQSQTDFQFMLPAQIGKLMELRHTLEPAIAMSLNQRATLSFLYKHLNIPSCDHFDNILAGQDENVILGTNLDLSQVD